MDFMTMWIKQGRPLIDKRTVDSENIHMKTATQRRRTRHLTAIGDSDDDLAKWEQTQRNPYRQSKLNTEKSNLLKRAGLMFAERPPAKSRLQMPHEKLQAKP
jgi:hypothetical protein